MAYTKNLGQVKGDKGDYFTPSLTVENGQIIFRWQKTDYQTATSEITQSIDLPIYYPTSTTTTITHPNGTTEESPCITFVPNYPLNNHSPNEERTFILPKGDKGDDGQMMLTIQHLEANETLDDIIEPRHDTIYVKGTKAWVYDYTDNNDEHIFFPIEVIDLSNYYTKEQTYSKDEIDYLFQDTANYMALMLKLLDVNAN